MALEITVGPPRLAITHGYGVFITEQDGQIPWPTDKGFYHCDTRIISSWYVFANGVPFNLLNSGNITYYANRVFLINRAFRTAAGDIAAGAIGFSISRSIEGGVTRISTWSLRESWSERRANAGSTPIGSEPIDSSR